MTGRLSLLLVISVFGLPLGLVVGCSKTPEQKRQDSQEAAAAAFAEAFAKLGEANEQAVKVEEDKLEMRTVKLGEIIHLGSLELTPVSAVLRKIKVKSLFGDQSKEEGPFLVLTITAKNISEGQVFKPFMTAEVRDNFGNELEDGIGLFEVGLIEGNEAAEEISPGETRTVLLCKAVKIPKATNYQWDVSSAIDNMDNVESWRCNTTVSEIKTAEASQ